MFEVVCKKITFFETNNELRVKICLVLCAGPTGTQNQDPRPLSKPYESNSGLRIGKRAYIENHIFQCKHYCLNLHEISVS